MKTIGLLGGMSWESTEHYYRLINELTRERLGGLHSAPIVMLSVDFHHIEALQRAGDWASAGRILIDSATKLEAAGAEIMLICTNTMHKVADEVQAAINIPLLHIADATAERIIGSDVSTVGLLGTRFTMEQDFYKARLEQQGLRVLIPPPEDRQLVHQIIYEELCLGKILDESRSHYLRVVDELATQGAQAVIAGCTEIGLLIKQHQTTMPLFDTTEIHAEQAVADALVDTSKT